MRSLEDAVSGGSSQGAGSATSERDARAREMTERHEANARQSLFEENLSSRSSSQKLAKAELPHEQVREYHWKSNHPPHRVKKLGAWATWIAPAEQMPCKAQQLASFT
jgi:hypothetical protein